MKRVRKDGKSRRKRMTVVKLSSRDVKEDTPRKSRKHGCLHKNKNNADWHTLAWKKNSTLDKQTNDNKKKNLDTSERLIVGENSLPLLRVPVLGCIGDPYHKGSPAVICKQVTEYDRTDFIFIWVCLCVCARAHACAHVWRN